MLVAQAGCRDRDTSKDAAPSRATPTMPAPDKAVRIIYPAAPGSFVDLVADARASVVNIRSTAKVTGGPASIYPDKQDEYSLGSGLLVDTQGHVLTNDHVLANASELRVRLSTGEEHAARVVGRDPKLDIALIKIDAVPRLTPAKLGDSSRLQLGEWVIALGNPFGYEVTVSAGVVSGLGRTDQSIATTRRSYRSFIQTDAAIDVGNSGGPLLNTAGQVVGILTATKLRGTRTGFVVPIDAAKRVLGMLKSDGVVTRAWLGAFVHPVTRAVAQQRSMKTVTGALVSELVPGAPAAKAHLKPGDVILSFDGKKVTHLNLPWIASTTGINRQVEIIVWRNGGEVTLQMTTERMPK